MRSIADRVTLAGWAVLLVAVGLAYGAAVNHGYVWDDRFFFTDYKVVHDFAEALRVAFRPLFGQHGYVRPIPMFLLHAESILASREAWLSHAVNLFLHWLCSGLVFVLARRAVRHAWPGPAGRVEWALPLLLALLFAVHPALTEAPVWVSSRFDLMATLFMLLALWVWTSALPAWPRAGLVAALFFLGALCKESVVVLPMVLFVSGLLHAGAAGSSPRPSWIEALRPADMKAYGLMLFAGVIYLVLRYWVLSEVPAATPQVDTLDAQLARFVMSLCKYVQLTFLPFFGQSPQHSFAWGAEGDLRSIVPQLLLGGGLLATVAALAIRRNVLGLVLFAWIFSYWPVLHILPIQLGGNLVHQRFMYFPTALLLVLAPYAMARITVSAAARRALWLLGGGAAVVSILLVRSIVPMWNSDLALWEWAVRADPGSRTARENLIWSYVDQGRLKDAEGQLAEMQSLGIPVGARVAINMGTAYYREGDYDQAVYYYEAAMTTRLALPPMSRAGLFGSVAVAYAMQGNPDKARHYIERALSEPEYGSSPVGNYLAFCHGEPGDGHSFSPDQVRAALPTVRGVTRLLVKNQPALYRAGAFCPERVPRPR